jgi:hypothetical protein
VGIRYIDVRRHVLIMHAFSYEMIIGIPPFYDKSSNKMFLNIESAPIRWPDPVKHGISITPEA